MADVFKANFKQPFDFFRCFGNFYDEVVVGFFVERLFDLNVKKGCVKPFVAEKLLDVERVFRLMIERCGLPPSLLDNLKWDLPATMLETRLRSSPHT